MTHYSLFVLLCVIAALASYFNYKYLKMPKAIGLTALSALISLSFVILLKINQDLFAPIYDLLNTVDFKVIVLKILLGYLLFAAAMHLNFAEVKKSLSHILVLSSLGVVVSSFIIGTLCWYTAPFVINENISYVHCLMVGAIFSPTDPVTVFAVFKTSKNIPTKIKSILTGEALLNDVFSIVLFLILLSIIVHGNDSVSFNSIGVMFLREGLGGVLLGVVLGCIGSWFIKRADDGYTLIMVTLAIVSGGSWIANQLLVSEPLTMVIAGIVIANTKSKSKLSVESKQLLTNFWTIVDELLNAFLFVLVGVEALEMSFSINLIIAGIVVFIISLIARYLSVIFSILIIDRSRSPNFWKNSFVITWAGLRGGVSIALILSMPIAHRTEHAFSIIYIAVLLSIFIQGISFKKVLDKAYSSK